MSISIKNYVYYTKYVYINIMTVREGTNQFEEKQVTNIILNIWNNMKKHEKVKNLEKK